MEAFASRKLDRHGPVEDGGRLGEYALAGQAHVVDGDDHEARITEEIEALTVYNFGPEGEAFEEVASMKEYCDRIVDDMLSFKLECSGAVHIKGPKWCGKSTTAEQKAHSVAYLQDKSSGAQQMALSKKCSRFVFGGRYVKADR